MQLPDFLRYPKLPVQLEAFNCDKRDKRGVQISATVCPVINASAGRVGDTSRNPYWY